MQVIVGQELHLIDVSAFIRSFMEDGNFSAEQLGPVSLILMVCVFVIVGYVLIYIPLQSAFRFVKEEEKNSKDAEKKEEKKEKNEDG